MAHGLPLETRSDLEKAYEIMKFCIDRGVNFFDNAEAYANGVAETMMGKALQKKYFKPCGLNSRRFGNHHKIFFGVKRPRFYPSKLGCPGNILSKG